MTIEGEVGKRREQEVSKAASAWWKDLSKELDDSYTSTTKIKDLIVSSNNTFPGRPGNRGSLEFMLIVRRVTFASLVWLVQRYGVHDLEKIIQGYVNTKSNALIAAGPFRAGVPKVFKNSHSIKTDQLQQGKGLLKEERDWLKETFGEFSFESIASRKP